MKFKKRDYDEAKKQLWEKYQSDLAALERTWELFGTPKSADGNGVEKSSASRGDLIKRVEEIVLKINGEFSVGEVSKELHTERPASVSQALVRLVDKEVIDIVKKGKDRWNPTVYKKR